MRTRWPSPALFLSSIALCIPGGLQAQPYWARHVGSLGNDHISDVKADAAGNLYVTGEFSGTADFEEETLYSTGGLDFFVAKLNSAGDVIWWKQGGGYGLDRGIKLAFGPGNTLAVVGEFMGTATFQGATLTSGNFTADMFVMQLDRTTGDQQWIRQGGGSAGADRPYGVTVSDAGQVTVAGEFKGTATWDGFSLTSIPDPETLEPTMDVVVVSYNAAGTALWVQHGAADHTDRSIDVVNDPQGNIYVAGQFSDTITFDVEHLNAMYNATFLLKLDAAGNELWFRRCGGAIYDHVRDLMYTPDGELLLAGDLQGSMIFLDDAPDVISGEQDHNYYLLRVGTDGQLIAQGQIGSSNGLSARGIDLRDDTIAVVGQFNCQFTSMSDFYGGPGLFMAAGSEDIFLNKHRYSDLGFIAARHYGGPGSKLAGQVAILPDGDPVMCGSYARDISFPSNIDNSFDPDTFYQSNEYTDQVQVPFSCPWSNYIDYPTQDCRGLKDGLLARAWVEDSVWYNWWEYPEAGCAALPVAEMCIGDDWSPGDACPDTLERCALAYITARLPMVYTLEWGGNSTGPLVHILWNTGDTTVGIEVESTGWYSVQVDAANGCWSWNDSLYVIVNQMPPEPLISDDVVVNTNAPYPAEEIVICHPDSAFIWCPNIDYSTEWFWTFQGNGGSEPDTVYSDTVVADTSGWWSIYMITAAGCMTENHVHVLDLATPELGDWTLDLVMDYPQDPDDDDSLWLCEDVLLQYATVTQWYLSGLPTVLPMDLQLFFSLNGEPWDLIEDNHDDWTGSTLNYQAGWNAFHPRVMVLNAPCGDDTLLFEFADSLWIGIWPHIPIAIDITGPTTMCVGDTVLLNAVCANCDAYEWQGGNVYGETTPSVTVLTADNYTVVGYVNDTNGCSWSEYAYHWIEYPPGPLLLTDPADGIICPDDSALIYTDTPGTDQIWYGPYGPVPNASQQLWSWVAGEYYLSMVDLDGCALTSDPVLLTGYGTPYLNVTPDNVICLVDDEVLIQVVTTVPSSIVWGPPFGGSALEQTVTEPGTYTVTAAACGITTELSVTVIGSDVQAEVVDPGPFEICPGDTAFLQAQPGAALYVWQPGGVYADVFAATEAGEYVLQAIDGNGCVDESEPVIVTWYEFDQALVAIGDSICPGEQAALSATGSGSITWFSDAEGQVPVFSGSTFTASGITSDSTFYVQQTDGTCSGLIVPVQVVVLTIGTEISFTGPQTACSGASVGFTASATDATQYDWVTPTGPAQGPSIVLDPVSLANAGLYTCTATAGNCGSVTGSFTFNVVATVPMDLGPDVSLCDGGSAVFAIDASFTDIFWNGVPGGTEYTAQEGQVIVQATDTSGCPATDTVLVDMFQFTLPVTVNDVTICEGENALFLAVGSGTIDWSTEQDMDPVTFTGNSMTLEQPGEDAVWYLVQTENGCSGPVLTAQLIVNPVPEGAVLTAPLFTCAGDTLVLTIEGPPGMNVQWSTPGGNYSGTSITVLDFSLSDGGLYQAITSMGDCVGDTLVAEVDFQELLPFSLGPDTTFCVGGSIVLTVPPAYTDPMWSTGWAGYTLDVSIDGTYIAYAVDDNGCEVQDEVEVMGEECAPVVPNFITPNGDGVNDAWHLDAGRGGFRTAEVIIFDRHGGEVFHGDPSRTDFRGENDTGEPLSEGVYFYVLRLFKLDGSTIEREGYLHVNR